MLKTKGIKELRGSLMAMSRMSFDLFVFALANQVKDKQISRMASVSNKMIKNTKTGIVRPGQARIVVQVPYAAHNHQGQRQDGSHRIVNRTSPGEQYWAVKAIQDMKITNAEVAIITRGLERTADLYLNKSTDRVTIFR